jgi:hypothetical protein
MSRFYLKSIILAAVFIAQGDSGAKFGINE